VKNEASANRTLLVRCPECAAIYLNRRKDES